MEFTWSWRSNYFPIVKNKKLNINLDLLNQAISPV